MFIISYFNNQRTESQLKKNSLRNDTQAFQTPGVVGVNMSIKKIKKKALRVRSLANKVYWNEQQQILTQFKDINTV